MVSIIQVNKPECKEWGKLTSTTITLQNLSLNKSTYKIGRDKSNDICIPNSKVSKVHCILTRLENGIIQIKDVSSNGTFIGEELIGKDNSKQLMPGDIFYILPAKKNMGFVFSFSNTDVNSLKRRREGEEEKKCSLRSEKQPKRAPTDEEREELKCLICQGLVYEPLIAMPCLHNFCGGCYSSISGDISKCPECLGEMTELKRNSLLEGKVLKFFEKFPHYKRTADETKLMSQKNKFPNGVILKSNIEEIKKSQGVAFLFAYGLSLISKVRRRISG